MSSGFDFGGLGDLLGPFYGGTEKKEKREPETRPLPQIRGRRIDGVLYVRAEDVADALEIQAPASAERLIKKLRGGAPS